MSELRLSIILIVLLLIIGVLMGIWVMSQLNPEISPEGQIGREMIYVQGNSLAPISPVYIPHTLIYGDLIECLVFEESKGDPNAYNPCDTDKRPKFGCLQFGAHEFHYYCVERYNLKDDIWDCEIQKECAGNMISEGLAKKWGTLTKCKGR